MSCGLRAITHPEECAARLAVVDPNVCPAGLIIRAPGRRMPAWKVAAACGNAKRAFVSPVCLPWPWPDRRNPLRKPASVLIDSLLVPGITFAEPRVQQQPAVPVEFRALFQPRRA